MLAARTLTPRRGKKRVTKKTTKVAYLGPSIDYKLGGGCCFLYFLPKFLVILPPFRPECLGL